MVPEQLLQNKKQSQSFHIHCTKYFPDGLNNNILGGKKPLTDRNLVKCLFIWFQNGERPKRKNNRISGKRKTENKDYFEL